MRMDADAKSAAGSAPIAPVRGTGRSGLVMFCHHTGAPVDGQAGATDRDPYIGST
jgi:hypothetical protein